MAKSSVGFAASLLFLGALRLCVGKLMLGATLDTYPGASCDHTPSGLVSVTFGPPHRGRKLGGHRPPPPPSTSKMTFGFQLSGLPASESGGIHIHVGTTCDDADSVGGHYWTPDADDDPWTDVTWSSDSDGSSSESIQLETGYDYEENLGHAVVYHNHEGARCGCGLLTQMKPKLTAKIKTYPDYTGNIAPTGTVVVNMMEDNMHMQYGLHLQNLETSTAGGVHIHAGTTCDLADDVGGHYWTPETETDVWTAVKWASDEKGKSTSSSIILSDGYAWQDNVGHAVVVHAADGTRVGCGILDAGPQKPSLTAKIETYPDYSGDVAPTGIVTVQMMADNMHMEYGFDLQNLEASTAGGVHIHSGTTCDSADDVGGHYWTPETDTDVWTAVKWASNEDGKSTSSSIILSDGYGYDDNVGHAVVVHAADGSRVGCGILKSQVRSPHSRLYSLTQTLQGSASTVQLAGLASVSVAAILAVVAFRMKKAESSKLVAGEDATEAEDSEEDGLMLY